MPDPVSQTPAGGAPAGGTPTPGVSLGTPANGNPTPAAGSPTGSDPAGGGGAKPWYDGLVKDEGNLKIMQTANWSDLDAAMKSYGELQTKLSSSRPASQAPADPKEYKFDVPAELSKVYNTKFADGFRQWAHKSGLSQEQAAGIHSGYLDFAKSMIAEQSQSATEAAEQSITTSMGVLTKAWGQAGTPAFTRSLEMAKRSMSHLDPGLAQELRDVGAVVKVGNEEMIAKPAIFLALSKAGQTMFAEDSLFGEKNSGVNPFDTKTEDRAAQGRMIKTDPARAELLIRAAGPEVERLYEHFLADRRKA